ncbi:MAG: hypothetical protein AAGH43_13970 [Pseudomonadota bacterium]
MEKRPGLVGQPRAVVFHEKENRLHAHAVWSRVDAETMTAKHLPFFKNKLFALARDLHLEFGFEMPRGMAEKGASDPTNFTLAEWQQCKRQGVDPRWLKKSIQDCWSRSDGLNAFQASLIERSFHLTKGDRRGHVIVDHTGEVYSLARMLGVKTKDVRARLGEGDTLQGVDQSMPSWRAMRGIGLSALMYARWSFVRFKDTEAMQKRSGQYARAVRRGSKHWNWDTKKEVAGLQTDYLFLVISSIQVFAATA